jgi:hypothetical protein
MPTVTVFTDTNAFIQLRDLKDLPWGELFPKVKHVSIMIARSVIGELDKHKVSTNARRRDRARAALRLIDAASAASDRTITLKEKPVKVTLTISRRLKPDWESLPDLDPTDPDDQLVAATVAYGQGAVLLSHDSGPRISARDVSLIAYEPPESWLLPLEQSDDERKIAKLKRDLSQALETRPRIEVSIGGVAPDGSITLIRPVLEPLSTDLVSRLASLYIQGRKRMSLTATPDQYAILTGGYSQSDVSRYHEKYDKFEEQVAAFFANLHTRITQFALAPAIAFDLANISSVSAADLHVTISIGDGLGFIADMDDLSSSLEPPTPPERPRPRDLTELSRRHTPSFEMPALKEELHPTEFEWLERPKASAAKAILGCRDFRPQRRYEGLIWIWPRASLPTSAPFEVIAGANSHPDVSARAIVHFEERPGSWHSPAVLAAVPMLVRTELLTAE